MRREKKRSTEPTDPYERWLKVKERVNAQRANGKFTTADRIRDEQIAAHKQRLEDQLAAEDRPISERVAEYVLDHDERGSYIGLRPASPQTPDPMGRSER